MKILMISEKDAANVSLAKIASEFLALGHQIEVFAPYFDESVLKFFPQNILKHPLTKLTAVEIERFDIIFASSMAGLLIEETGILLAQKPIFTHNYLINKQIVWGGDFCFVPSLETVRTEYDSYLQFVKIPVGEPKYDQVLKIISEKKQFLFIDSGHFPFGERGKRELARTLLAICNYYPDYTLVIKPRFLPSDTIITHQNKINIYDILLQESEGCLPANLNMLSEHRDLQELIDESHTVICLYTTAFAGAVLAGKGLVILDHLPNDDAYDIRKKIFYRVRELMIESGALVDYHYAINFLPHGIKASEKYKKRLFAEEMCSAERICRKVEQLAFLTVDWNRIIKQRYSDYMIYRAFIHTDFHAKASMDIESAYIKIIKFVEHNIPAHLRNKRKDFHEVVKRAALDIRNECIIDNRDLFIKDEIDIGIYLNALYLDKKYKTVLDFPECDVAAVYFYKGMISFKLGDFRYAKEMLIRFANKSAGRAYIKEISDMPDNKRKGIETLIFLLERSGENEQADIQREKWLR